MTYQMQTRVGKRKPDDQICGQVVLWQSHLRSRPPRTWSRAPPPPRTVPRCLWLSGALPGLRPSIRASHGPAHRKVHASPSPYRELCPSSSTCGPAMHLLPPARTRVQQEPGLPSRSSASFCSHILRSLRALKFLWGFLPFPGRESLFGDS